MDLMCNEMGGWNDMLGGWNDMLGGWQFTP